MTKNSRSTTNRSFQALLGAVAACVLVLLAIGGFKGYRDIKRARVREEAIESKIDEAELEVKRLENRIRALRDDPTSLERMARDQFNMVHPNDVIIMLPSGTEVTSEEVLSKEDPSEGMNLGS